MGPEVITTISPSTNKPVLTRTGLSDSDIALLPSSSTQAFGSFRLTSLEERRSIVGKALKLISEKQNVLARELTEQMGRPIAYTAVEIKTAVKRGEYLLKISADALKDTEGEPEKGFKRYIRKAPIGPVLILFAWNVGSRSVAAGLQVQKAAAERVVPVGLELGGKDPAYIRDDVDIKWAAEEIVDGAVFNSGQSCCSVERVYVAECVYDQFVAAVQEVLKGYKLGDPFDQATNIGPVISRRSAETIKAHVDDAISKGAIDSTPLNQSFSSPPPGGNYVKPTLLTNVTHDMDVMNDETFGPVIPVMKVGDDEEAIRLMNDSEFGLTASIWTKDTVKGEELAEHVEAGTIFINRCDFPSPDLAWTGWKNSGKGVTLSKFGFEQFVKLKSFHIKDYPM
ncbi:hypothetical protein P7C71_g4167, partial [Lecanoromycetidae sp. Uapishka_2]